MARRRILGPLAEFLQTEAAGGAVLLGATVVALVWANTATSSYADFWHHELTIGRGEGAITESLQHWVNDGLMAVFFFVVGLEIKRELVRGELRDPRAAALPVLAALGGMLVPALVYTAWNAGGPGSDGWGVPMATDIAFAVGVLALFGSRVPAGAKLFLLTLAIVDDLGAILVIALFYSSGIEPGWLAGAALGIALVLVMQRLGIGSPWAYVLPAAAIWYCAFESGVHATIAGVVVGLLTPAHPFRGRPVIERLEHGLHPWTSFAVVPLFALANAGVVIDSDSVRDAAESAITWGIVTGLVLGKLVGITAAAWLGLRLRWGRLPEGMEPRHVPAVATLAGIGFTVSLFVAELSFRRQALVSEAKLGVLAASTVAGLAGALATRLTTHTRR